MFGSLIKLTYSSATVAVITGTNASLCKYIAASKHPTHLEDFQLQTSSKPTRLFTDKGRKAWKSTSLPA